MVELVSIIGLLRWPIFLLFVIYWGYKILGGSVSRAIENTIGRWFAEDKDDILERLENLMKEELMKDKDNE